MALDQTWRNGASRIAATRWAAAAILLSAVAGCGAAQDIMGASLDHVPESPGVENAPYPSLADAPEPAPPFDRRAPEAAQAPQRDKAQLQKALSREAESLRAEARRMDRAQIGDGGVVVTHNQRAAAALAEEEAAVKASSAGEAERLRAEIEAELNAAFGEDAAAE